MTDLEIDGLGPGTLIDGGASASVFAATRTAVGDRVAIKVLKQTLTDETARRHFRHEVRALQELAEAPGIVSVLESGFTKRGEPYLMLPLFSGSTQQSIDRGETMQWQRATRMIADASRAVDYAHRQGIFHRDIKPANLLMTSSDDVFVTDFGIAILTDSSLTGGWAAFTPAYAPPEALEPGDPTAQGDVYSLAASLVALITGAPPFETADGEGHLSLMRRIAEDPPPNLRPHGAPEELAQLVEQAMAKSTAARPASAAAFADALIEILGDHPEAQRLSPPTVVADAPASVTTGPSNLHGAPATRSAGAVDAAAPASGAAASSSMSPMRVALLAGIPALIAAAVIFLVLVANGSDDDAGTPGATPAVAETPGTAETEVQRPAPNAVIVVAADGSGDAVDLAAAVDAAVDGTEIRLDAGTFTIDETVLIERPLRLVGAGQDLTTLRSTTPESILLVANTTATVSDLTAVIEVGPEPAERVPVIVIENTAIALERVEVRGGWGDGVFLFDATGIVRDAVAETNRGSGVAFGGTSNVELVGGEARGNGTGYSWIEQATGTAFGATAEANDGVGVYVEGEAAPRLSGLTSIGNGDGFAWFGSARGSADASRAENNTDAGFLVGGDAAPDLSDNESVSNGFGYSWFERAAGDVIGNLAEANRGEGFVVGGTAAPGLRENTSSGNGSHGFAFYDETEAFATANTARGNEGDAFFVDPTSSARLADNTDE